MAREFKIPELGENIESGDVAKVLVSPGDILEKDQPVLELETDKAVVEIPSTVSGKVKELRVKTGDQVTIGQVILTLEEEEEGAKEEAEASPAEAVPKTGKEVEAPEEEAVKEEKRQPPPEAPPMETPAEEESEKELAPVQEAATTTPAPATPSVRRLARELGVDIHQVQGSGPGGRISMDDVKHHARALLADRIETPASAASSPVPLAAPLPEFEKWGAVERESMSKIRRKTAEHMNYAWTIPHVTQHDYADITQLEQDRGRFAKRVEKAGGKLTVTAILLKVIASALKIFPRFNTSLDLATQELIHKRYCHIGVAVDTEHGLLVPVIRQVNQKSIVELAIELAELAEKARSRKLSAEEMEGGTFTITNLGGLGGSHFTPVINWPETAILGISRAKMAPLYIEETFQPRLLLPLSLSYDHRVIDGADAIRFLRWVVEALEDPFLLSLEG